MENKSVTIYSTPTCHFCQMAKEFFAEKGVEYTGHDVASDAAKTSYVRQLLAKRKGGRALIFCDWIERGQQIADALDVPFVHGATPRKLERVLESEVCVVSRIGDRGLDLRDLKLVIEVAGAGAAREQFAQRVGRLLHGEFEGEFHTVFTPDEAERYRPRVFGVEAELAGEVDIEFVNGGVIAEPVERTVRARPDASRAPNSARYSAGFGFQNIVPIRVPVRRPTSGANNVRPSTTLAATPESQARTSPERIPASTTDATSAITGRRTSSWRKR